MVVRLEKFDRDKGVLLFRKAQDLKGRWPAELIRQAIPAAFPDRGHILQWAEPGKQTVMCALESYKWSHTYIDGLWFASTTTDWLSWNVSHPEPILLRTWCGRSQRLPGAAAAMLANREVVAPCLVGDNPDDLKTRRARVQRIRASLKLLDYNPRRDFLAWGTDDLTQLSGMPGFTHALLLPPIGADAHTAAAADFTGDGRPDLCLAGLGRAITVSNGGDYFAEAALPASLPGCRAAAWADYDGDGKPDLLLATPAGPKLYTNLGLGNFRDDSHLLPREPVYNLTAAAWLDYDGDGRPDILLANGFHGLRLYRNKGKADAPPAAPARPGAATLPAGLYFQDVSDAAGLGEKGVCSSRKGDVLSVCDVDGDGLPDFLYDGLLVLNTARGFVEARDYGLRYRPGGVGPSFGDYDGDGRPDLIVPQDTGCKLFRNYGGGHFRDVTEKVGLNAFKGHATSASWGDVDNDGHLDLVIGCLHGPNRYFHNGGDGTFEDATEALGLHKRIFNTQAVLLTDLNADGALDAVFNNEGQEPVVLLGTAQSLRRSALQIYVGGSGGTLGAQVRVLGNDGRALAEQQIARCEGRSQSLPVARFALSPGTYHVEVRYSCGLRRAREVEVVRGLTRATVDDRTSPVQ